MARPAGAAGRERQRGHAVIAPRRPFSAVAAALLCAAVAAGAAARPAAAGSSKRDRARRLFQSGERAYDAGRYRLAAQAFEASFRLLPLPAIAFSAAQAYRLEYFADKDPRRLKRAVELYRIYVKMVKHGGRRPGAVEDLAELEPILQRVQASKGAVADVAITHHTTLYVSSQVDGATGAFDGGAAQSLPFSVEVKPGMHTITVRAKGYFPMTRHASVLAGHSDSVDFELKPKPALVSLSTEDGADVAVDGRPVGRAPFSRPLALSAGTHHVTVTRVGRRPFVRDLHVTRAQALSLRAPLATTTQRRISYWVLGAAAASLTAAGVTGALAFAADRHAASLESTREHSSLTAAQFADYQATRSRRDSRLHETYALAGIGVALAAGGAALFFLDHPRPEMAPPAGVGPAGPGGPNVSVVPMAGPAGTAGAGVTVAGRF